MEGGLQSASRHNRRASTPGCHFLPFDRLTPIQEQPVEVLAPTSDTAEALELARRVVDLASEKQASDIVLLDIRGVSLIADYFVIATAASERQASAILRDLSEKLIEEFGRKPMHTEGKPDSGWVLLDFGDVIVDRQSRGRDRAQLRRALAAAVAGVIDHP